MKHTHIYIVIALIAAFGVSCKHNGSKVALATLADTAAYFHTQIQTLEKQRNGSNIDDFLRSNTEILAIRKHADSVIQQYFAAHSGDTLFLSFDQSKNTEKFTIQKLWVSGAEYNQLFIQARVYAMDNGSVNQPYISLAIKQRDGSRLESGGGIMAVDSTKLTAGKTYLFSGAIHNLSALQQVRSVFFDETIQQW
ncbi:MAG: hypothetical protein LBU90_02935 [Bacteroidales bacterium]|nr:hypothetical protein [Bacteroidales bacterium]